jgi:hypothetical protein
MKIWEAWLFLGHCFWKSIGKGRVYKSTII